MEHGNNLLIPCNPPSEGFSSFFLLSHNRKDLYNYFSAHKMHHPIIRKSAGVSDFDTCLAGC